MIIFLKFATSVFLSTFIVTLISRIFDIHFLKTKHIRRNSNMYLKRANWLNQAGIKINPRQFLIMTIGSMFLTFLIISIFSRAPLVALVPSIAAGALPYMSIAKKRNLRMRELSLVWPDALRDLGATLSSGHPLSYALSTLATTGPS